MTTRIARATLVFAYLLLLGGACDGSESADGRLVVVATTTQIGDMTANIGGDRIRLTTLLKPNQDAHDFAPPPSQIRKLQSAAVVLRNGIGLDAYVMKGVGGNKARVAIVTDGVTLRAAEGGPQEGGSDSASEAAGHDPHVWFSVANAQRMVENIRDALAQGDPANADYYRQNATTYLTSLDALDARLKAQVAQIPQVCRKLVTNHDTLGYYAATYGFEIVGSVIPSVSSEARPSAFDVADVVRKIREEKVPAIFAETSINPALVNQVGREAGVKVIDDLYGDSLGPKGSDGDTYIKMMEANTKRIVEALKDC